MGNSGEHVDERPYVWTDEQMARIRQGVEQAAAAAAVPAKPEPMSEARLAEIRERLLTDGVSRWLVRRESLSLLAEVERLRAREAALVAIVEQVEDCEVLWASVEAPCGHRARMRVLANWGNPDMAVENICKQARAVLASAGEAEAGEQTPPTDGERHDKWQYIAAYGYWVWMMSYDNWDDCAGLCEELCQRYGVGVWIDGARPGDYHPAANVNQTEAIRAVDTNKG